MNPNSTGYPTSMQQHANPMLAAAAGYPVQSGSPSNQQFPYYAAANPMAAYPPQMQQPSQARSGQMQQQHSFNPMQIHTSGPMMPGNIVAPHTNMAYSSPSPYHPTSIPTTSASPSHSQSPATAVTVSMQMPSQNMTAVSNPAMLLAQQQQQQQLKLQLQQQQQQRPTPPPVQQPQQSQQQQQQQQQQQAAPQSPATAARERARVTALLEINSALLQELLNLQAAGKSGGAPQAPTTTTPEQQSSSPNSAGEPASASSDAPRKPSPEYVECLKRLQSNLVYLASVTDRNKKPVSPAPAILTPPPHMGTLNEQYSKLNELFAGVPRPAVAHQPRPSQSGIPVENAA